VDPATTREIVGVAVVMEKMVHIPVTMETTSVVMVATAMAKWSLASIARRFQEAPTSA
jgi:hypothetical protein